MNFSQVRAGSPGGRRIIDMIRANQRADTAGAIAARIADNYALDAIREELHRRWPVVDASNVDQVLAWQQQALRELDRTAQR